MKSFTHISTLGTESISDAANALRRGGLVAFPTETVYGLGADATNNLAVAKIFEVKERPQFNPLIVHVPDFESVTKFAVINSHAEKLARLFWPGALTLVLPHIKNTKLSLLVSAGLQTVAIRVPAHKGARELLSNAGCPVAAPSANKSGRISPTTALHVKRAFGKEISVILDGGPSRIGVESTVLDVSTKIPVLLRPGGVPIEALEQALGQKLDTIAIGDENSNRRSPGMLSSHYSPSIPIRLNSLNARPGEALLGFGPNDHATLNLSETGDLQEAAANLFSHLHTLERGDFSAIATMPVPNHGLGRAINDRLLRAAEKNNNPKAPDKTNSDMSK